MKTIYTIKKLDYLRPLLIGFRKALGLRQKDVSERLGVTQQTYARLEANPSSASIRRIYKVFTVLGVEITLSCESLSSVTQKAVGAESSRTYIPVREDW